MLSLCVNVTWCMCVRASARLFYLIYINIIFICLFSFEGFSKGYVSKVVGRFMFGILW